MVITALCEPRSGSTNLAKWFKMKENFTSFIEPLNTVSRDYRGFKKIFDWSYNTKHLFIKEVYRPSNKAWSKKFDELIEFSDKIIILHRENKEEQIESWLNAIKTNNWIHKWSVGESGNPYREEDLIYLNNTIKEFKEKYFNNPNFLNITYEELYQSTNGIKRLIDFVGLEELTDDGFPFGERYRTESIVNKII